jgi:flagellar hook-associated protein 3 FlgL
MSITGPGSITALNVAAINKMNDQLTQLSQALGSGQASQTYAGLGSQAGVALSLNSQLAATKAYSNTATTVGTTLTVAQSVLTALGTAETSTQQSINAQGSFTLNANGQTSIQASAITQLDNIFSLLNTQVGSNYLFSGSAPTQPSVASTNSILYGNGVQAGLTQVISERQQADLGTGDMGRLTVGGTGANVTLSQDGSPFGFQLAGVNSSLTGATASGPTGSPPTISIALASNPNPGDTIQFALTLPDGSSQTISLQATNNAPPASGQFTIGVDQNATAANLQTALGGAITTLAQAQLPAASSIAASNNFFSSDPPMRVGGPPFNTATSLVAGTPSNTVFWYSGESGSTSARQTATAQVGPSTTIAYGMRANEQALTTLVANVAAFAATTFSASDPNAQSNYQALSQKVTANLDPQSGVQQISDIEGDLANAQTTVKSATDLNTQNQSTLQGMLQGIDGVDQNDIGEQLITLQNSLSASMSVTARLAQLSLVNFLSPVSG